MRGCAKSSLFRGKTFTTNSQAVRTENTFYSYLRAPTDGETRTALLYALTMTNSFRFLSQIRLYRIRRKQIIRRPSNRYRYFMIPRRRMITRLTHDFFPLNAVKSSLV